MFYNAIHARRRKDGVCVVLACAFALSLGNPDGKIVEQWQTLSQDPRIGAEYTHLHRFLDNRLVESLELPHPDEAEAERQRLNQDEAERAAAENLAEREKLLARLAELEAAGITPEAAIAAREAAEAKRLAEEEAAAAEAKRLAEEEAAAAEAKRLAEEEAAAAEAKRLADEEAAAAEAKRLADEQSSGKPAAQEPGASGPVPPQPPSEPDKKPAGRLTK